MMPIFMQDFEIADGRDMAGMVEKIWRAAQIQNLLDMQEKYKIPQEVIRAVEHIAEILDAEFRSYPILVQVSFREKHLR